MKLLLKYICYFVFIMCFSIDILSIPLLISYQGKLTDVNGVPSTGNQTIVFKIYSVENSTETVHWQETQTIVLNNGHFSATLGSVETISMNIFDENNLKLAIKVGADNFMQGIDLLSSPFAFKSGNSELLDGLDSNQFLRQDLSSVTIEF